MGRTPREGFRRSVQGKGLLGGEVTAEVTLMGKMPMARRRRSGCLSFFNLSRQTALLPRLAFAAQAVSMPTIAHQRKKPARRAAPKTTAVRRLPSGVAISPVTGLAILVRPSGSGHTADEYAQFARNAL
jgi:hypothetical protein